VANPFRVGIVGCGKISNAYFEGLKPYAGVRIAAVADLDPVRAHAKAAEHGVAKACATDELLADPDIDGIINLTIPGSHASVNLAAIAHGKHVYVEKPWALDRTEGARVIEAADLRGVRAGCAPDTFLGGGIQTCRRLIDEGAIGEPVSATAFMCGHGHESWHPSPEFYYKRGGGPMFDMGPYYLTALVNLIGPIRRVAASVRTTFPTRTITSEPLRGDVITVDTPTHLAGTVDFSNGAIGTVVMSFDVWGNNLPRIEIHGTEGSLSVPDPNTFGGVVRLLKAGTREWIDLPLTHSDKVGRGIGLADLARAIEVGRPHRTDASVAQHVVDVMQAFEESSDLGQHITIGSTCVRPAPLPAGLAVGELD